jgi:osmoprotectant transport system ATP-binding protein
MSSSAAEIAISLRGVTKTFPGADAPAVSDLSLDIPRGEIVALVGPSGCGKTTTLKMINRLVELTSGTIDVLGRPQNEQPTHELRRSIGYVIQQVGLFPHHTIRRNVATVPKLLGWPAADIEARVTELVDLVGLDPSVLDRYPSELSGGQQQRIGVARALAADPPILLMDEPYSAVDPIVRERLQDELLALQAKVGKTIVIVTHDIDEAIRLGDRVAILDVGGVLEQYDTPEELLRNPASPFVAAFLGRERGLRRLGIRRVDDIATIAGPVHDVDDPVSVAAKTMAEHSTEWVALTERGRLVGWTTWADVEHADPDASLGSLPRRPFVARVRPDTPLREALDTILTSHSRMAAVTDDDRLLGMITIDQLAEGLE